MVGRTTAGVELGLVIFPSGALAEAENGLHGCFPTNSVDSLPASSDSAYETKGPFSLLSLARRINYFAFFKNQIKLNVLLIILQPCLRSVSSTVR